MRPSMEIYACSCRTTARATASRDAVGAGDHHAIASGDGRQPRLPEHNTKKRSTDGRRPLAIRQQRSSLHGRLPAV
uniref:DUF1534 domain-containing protein n=1 Tax=Panagrellus redivivus TaxID=6233 RepID=A0A7E4V5Z7_PANRE